MSTATWYLRRKGVIGFTALLLAVSCDSGPEKPPPVTGCTIAGMEYADNAVNPNSPCQSCQLSISATEWTNLSDGLSCNQGNSVCTSGVCKPGCFIVDAGMYYAAPDLDPTNSCKICHPAETTLDWSNLPDGTACAGGGVCTGGSCQVGCYILGKVYPERSDNPADPSTCCNKAADPSGWTSRLIPGSTFDLGGPGADIVAADFNGDGADDLAAVDTAHDWVSLVLSDGAGGFLPIHTLPTESAPRSIVATDLNGDGKPDLIVKSSGQKTLDVFLNQGGGAFSGQVSYPAGNGIPGSMVVGDFDGDGNQDLVCSQTEDGVVYFPGLGNGTLATGIPVLDAGGGTIATGDVNGDKALDLLNADPNAGLLDLLGGIGDGGYISGGTAPPLSPPCLDAFMGDVNGDGFVDLAYTTSADVQVYFNSAGGLTSPVILPVTQPPGGLGFGDLNGSGHPTLLVSSGGVGVLGTVTLDGGGTAQAVINLIPVAGGSARMAVGDFNGDHGLDVALFTGTSISLFLNGCP